MEFWFIILLSVIAVLAIGLLLFFELMGDDALRMKRLKHKRGEYINDQTAVICQSIKDTVDSHKAYMLFVEYLFINNRQFLEFVKRNLTKISQAYNSGDMKALHACVSAVKDMNEELNDQKVTQEECIATIDTTVYIEAAAWINLSNNCRINVNGGLKHIAEVCIEYPQKYREPFPDTYNEQLEYLVGDICNICNTSVELIGTTDITAMRELRKRMSVILDESYANTQRLYELIHDGRVELRREKRIALRYALNAFQELHCMIYTLRRFILANMGITLSLKTIEGTPNPIQNP